MRSGSAGRNGVEEKQRKPTGVRGGGSRRVYHAAETRYAACDEMNRGQVCAVRRAPGR